MNPIDEQIENRQLEGPRPARLEERDELIALVNLIFRISMGREPTIASDWPHVYEPANLDNVMVMSDGGKLVASTGVWPSDVMVGNGMVRVGGINCVGTLDEYRRYGLGSQVMEAAQARMRQLGCHAGLLSTGIMNWYRRLGWEEAGAVRTYRLNRGNIALLPPLPGGVNCQTAEVGEEHVTREVVRLHNREQMGAVRTVARLGQLLAARRVSRILLAESGGAAIAYLLARENNVVEWGGSIESVTGLVRAYFGIMDDPTVSTSRRDSASGPLSLRALTLATPAWQHPLPILLDDLRIPYGTDYLGMIYVVDPQPILNAFGSGAVTVAEVGDEFILTYRSDSVTLNRNQLAKLLFGPERISTFAVDLFPLPFWQWGLEKV